MKTKTSVSHHEVMIEKLRKRPAFAAEYLKAAIADTEEPQVLLIALRPFRRSPRRHRQGRESGRH